MSPTGGVSPTSAGSPTPTESGSARPRRRRCAAPGEVSLGCHLGRREMPHLRLLGEEPGHELGETTTGVAAGEDLEVVLETLPGHPQQIGRGPLGVPEQLDALAALGPGEDRPAFRESMLELLLLARGDI